jgi:hypothetical protein
MKEKWTPHIMVVSALVVFIVLGLACASTPESAPTLEIIYTEVAYSELWKKVRQVNSPGQGFIVEAYFNRTNAPGEGSFSIVSDPSVTETYWIQGHGGDGRGYREYRRPYENYFEQYDSQTYKRIDKNKPYRIYISLHQIYNIKDDVWRPFIDRIEGLRSLEEVAAIEAQQRAERETAQEARRQAREEANRYDPSKFTVVPSDFSPADYTSVDLFRAVSTSRNLQIVSNKQEAIYGQMQSAFMLGLGGTYVLEYVSDLTFVRQDGADITFSSDDNAITQTMTIDQRSGLQAGQKVRVYYRITRSPLTTWDVIAIERR